MSGEAIGYVYRRSPFRGVAFAVHLAIADVANDLYGNTLWASCEEIAKKARTGRQSVVRALADLTEQGFLERIGEDRPTGYPVKYRLLMPEREPVWQPRSERGGVVSRDRGVVSRDTQVSSPATGGVVSRDTELEVELKERTQEEERPLSRTDALEESIRKAGPKAVALVDLLVEKIVENGSKAPVPNERWYDAARLILTVDKRPADEAARLIAWCQADEFWRGNVLSMQTFRRQYDRLRLQSTRSNGNGRARGGGLDLAKMADELDAKRAARAAAAKR